MKMPIFLLALFATFAVHAQLFKCADAQGSITYQDTACLPGEQVGTIARDTRPGDLQAMERFRQGSRELDAAYDARQARESAERLAAAEFALRVSQAGTVEQEAGYPGVVGYPVFYARNKMARTPRSHLHRGAMHVSSSGHRHESAVLPHMR